MKKQLYVRPLVVEKKSKIRTSILAGSNDGAFNGITKGDVSAPPSVPIQGARQRVNFEM